jgi:hypothetical protein
MTTEELIYQKSKELPESEAQPVLDFIEFPLEKIAENLYVTAAESGRYE